MTNLNLIKNYQENEKMRNSFFDLATQVFGIHFHSWYEHGFWTEKYIPYSLAAGNKIIANVSINLINLIVSGEKKSALQVGTVMTHPDYRKKGLSTKLMNHILNEFAGKYDFMYLLANHNVLNFYPKFGFRPVQEYQYSMEFTNNQPVHSEIRKLDGKNRKDLQFIYDFSSERIPLSKTFGTENTQELLMFYCMNVFSNDVYYIENEDMIVLYKIEENEIHIFDLVSKKGIIIEVVLSKLTNKGTYKVFFHYTPEYEGIKFEKQLYTGSEVLFVREGEQDTFPKFIKHPLTSQA
ncbi:GNAT family N-acetyltransferase [Cytobacillus depressus]|uniref:GNAT family N-acetyltransferase n=1 Tax=Cytobacillus depressus TaxID=1602942 RepID=A0A6L3V561_9BACI|nr:GNAT family N-acetyltransferase [Cytobacillus depressus]KAB2333297.1 GNAT family N-acetyltransferase [Cytobacillus depressus]